MNTPLQEIGRRETQRTRLISALVELSAQDGYEGLTIARIIERAGVSRPTFYENFPEKDDCFLAAHADIQERLQATLTANIEIAGESSAAITVRTLLSFAEEAPEDARFLMSDTMCGGPRTLDARDRQIDELAALIEDANDRGDENVAIPELGAATLIGAIYRILASRLRRGERGLGMLTRELCEWVASYERPAKEHRWRAFDPHAAPAPARSPFVPQAPLRPPLPETGRARRCSAEALAENQRLRVMFATAEVVRRDGYPATTVAEITRVAQVDGRVFYALFADKRDAFTAVHELGFHHTMAVTAGAFFAAEDWPARIWEAARAFAQYLEQNPLLTHASLIESHAGGADTVQRLEDLMAGFTIFLQEGYQYRQTASAERGALGAAPSTLALEAIAAANFEALYRQARRRTPEMNALVGQITFTCLAPFLGPRAASDAVAELARATRSEAGGERPEGEPASTSQAPAQRSPGTVRR